MTIQRGDETMEIKVKRLPRSARKYIRLKKAQIRRQTVGKEEQEKLIQELYQKISSPSKTEEPTKKAKKPIGKAKKPAEKAKKPTEKVKKPTRKAKKPIKK